jgi:hypothetical protein
MAATPAKADAAALAPRSLPVAVCHNPVATNRSGPLT